MTDSTLPEQKQKKRALSPARRHFVKTLAAKKSGTSDDNKKASGDQYELMSAALWETRRILKNIKSIEAKIDKKRELLPQFTPYIEGVIAGDSGAQDNVMMTVMVWLFDIGDLNGALNIADYAIRHHLETADQYSRDTASLVAEECAEQALKELTGDDINAAELIASLQRVERLTANSDMHDPIRAKLHKALGYALRTANNLEAAHKHLTRALELHDRAGVKKDLEQIERQLKKQRESEHSAT